jgi:uncharacterized membrane protein YbhN (UPF0104 family)
MGKRSAWLVGGAALVIAVFVISARVDTAALGEAVETALRSPVRLVLVLAAFGGAFLVRSVLWSRVLRSLPLGDSLAAVHIGLAANHFLPLRMGEAVRPLVASRRAGVSASAAGASTLVLRVLDMAALLGLGWVAAPAVLGDRLGWAVWCAPVALGAAYAGGVYWLRRLPECRSGTVRAPNLAILAGTLAAWVLEAALVWQCAHWAGIPLSGREAVVVTAASIAAQIAGIAPGGVGTYEAAAVAAYTALGYPAGAGLAAAVLAHGFTTMYALGGGAVALALPRLNLVRLGRQPAAVEAVQ